MFGGGLRLAMTMRGVYLKTSAALAARRGKWAPL